MITNKDLMLLYITTYEGSGGWRRNSEETDRAVKKIMADIVTRETRQIHSLSIDELHVWWNLNFRAPTGETP